MDARRICALGLFGITSACGSDVEPPAPGPITATVQHYDIAFDTATRAITAQLELATQTGGDCVTLPFRGEGLAADATFNGAQAGGGVENGALTLCGDAISAGDALTIEVNATVPNRTQAPTQVGYSTSNDIDGNPFAYLVSWVGGCDQFAPCDNRADQFATYRFTVTHAAGQTALCPGTITRSSDTTTVCDFAMAGGPTYSTFGLLVGTFTAHDLGLWGGVNTTLFDNSTGATASKLDPTYFSGVMDFLQQNFGPYPYGQNLRLIAAPTYWAGFEHPGNITLDARLASLRPGDSLYTNPLVHTLTHELAHQWAGDQTTLADTYDFVWKEAMAEYLTYLHEASVNPQTARATANAWKAFSQGAAYYLVPGERPALVDYYGDVYGPGPMILFRQLAVQSSPAAVMRALQSVLGAERALSMMELEAALARETGLDVASYLADWAYGSGAPVWPRATASFARTGTNTGTVRVVHTNAATSPTCMFHVGLRSASDPNAAPVRVSVDLADGPDQTLPVSDNALAEPAFETVTAVLDVDAECLVYPAVTARAAPAVRRHPWVLADWLP